MREKTVSTIAGATAVASLLALAACGKGKPEPGGSAGTPAATAPAPAAPAVPPPTGEAAKASATEALSVLKTFYEATTSVEALRHVLHPDVVGEEVRGAFAARKLNPPAAFSHVGARPSRPDLGERPGSLCHVFTVEPEGADGPPAFPVAVYPAAGGGYRIDWHEYAQFRDGTLAKFFERGRKPGVFGEFQVVAVRGHFFGDKAPELAGGTVCLKLVGSRGQDDTTEAFIPADSPVWRAIEPYVGFERMARLKVRIRWSERPDGELFPEVVSLLDAGWFGWSGSGSLAGR